MTRTLALCLLLPCLLLPSGCGSLAGDKLYESYKAWYARHPRLTGRDFGPDMVVEDGSGGYRVTNDERQVLEFTLHFSGNGQKGRLECRLQAYPGSYWGHFSAAYYLNDVKTPLSVQDQAASTFWKQAEPRVSLERHPFPE